MTREEMANEIAKDFERHFDETDPYEYMDVVGDDADGFIANVKDQILGGDGDYLREELKGEISDFELGLEDVTAPEDRKMYTGMISSAQKIIKKLDAFDSMEKGKSSKAVEMDREK